MRLCTPALSGTNLDVSGIGGISDGVFVLYTSTNVVTSLALWTLVLTNHFDQFGVFSYTNLNGHALPQQYFRFFEQ